jgi:hypothetical protein
MGETAGIVIESVRDVIGFDTMVVTALHHFRDVFHYYSDMSGSCDQRLLALVSLDRTPNPDPPHKIQNITSLDQNTPNPGLFEGYSIPFVCLNTVLKDATTANLEINSNYSSSSNLKPSLSSSSKPNTSLNSTPDSSHNPNPSLRGLPLPLLSLQSADDPIIHIDTSPCRSGKPYPKHNPDPSLITKPAS